MSNSENLLKKIIIGGSILVGSVTVGYLVNKLFFTKPAKEDDDSAIVNDSIIV